MKSSTLPFILFAINFAPSPGDSVAGFKDAEAKRLPSGSAAYPVPEDGGASGGIASRWGYEMNTWIYAGKR